MNEETKSIDDELKAVSKTLRSTMKLIDAIQDAVIRTHRRVLTGNKLDSAVVQIWAYCRNNQDSLDSERHCRIIREVIEGAVSDVAQIAEGLDAAKCAAESELKETKKQLKVMTKANAEMAEHIATLKASADSV